MKLHIFGSGILFLVVLAACTGLDANIEVTATLPDPEVRVVDSPVETGEMPAELPDTLEVEAGQNPGPSMAFGLESHQANFLDHDDLVGAPGLTLMRHNGLLWYEIEPIEGERDWAAAADLERVLEQASASGLSTILIVRGTPQWAQRFPGSYCGPILPEKLDQFADFLGEAVRRYSQPPYNVRYWELGNEPDVDPLLVRSNSVFGCWGNYLDAYYGGGYYADMLKVVYPVIKSADPKARVLLGGLLLDCDPSQPPQGKDCSAGNFLEGVLSNGGGDYFDILSFHGYTPYFGPASGYPYELYMDKHNPSWEHLGGVVNGKINYIRQLFEKYQVEKPIYLTEAALMCAEYNPTDCDPPGAAFYDTQAEYAIRLYVGNWANGIEGTIWYQFEGPGWRYSGLLDEEQNPKPVYEALAYLANSLSQSVYNGEVSQYENLLGYEFISPGKHTWVLWSPEQIDISIPVPSDLSAAYDKYGSEVTPSGDQLVVNSPLYLEFTP